MNWFSFVIDNPNVTLFKWISIQQNVKKKFKRNFIISVFHIVNQNKTKKERLNSPLTPSRPFRKSHGSKPTPERFSFIALSRHFLPANWNFTRVEGTGGRLSVAWFHGTNTSSLSQKFQEFSFSSVVVQQWSRKKFQFRRGIFSFRLTSSAPLQTVKKFCDFRRIFNYKVKCSVIVRGRINIFKFVRWITKSMNKFTYINW